MKHGTYIRISDGMPVPEDEAMQNGALRAGYRMRVGRMMTDHAIGGSTTMVNDETIRFMDHLPGPQAARIHEIIADAGSNELFRVQRAREGARQMSTMLSGTAYTDQSMTTDSYKRAHLAGAAYLQAVSDQAWTREQSLYGDGGLNAMASYEAMKDRDRDAWRGPQATADRTASTLTGDTRADAYEAMKQNDANAWRNGR